MTKTTETAYIEWCTATETVVSDALQRPLTRPELRGIRNAGGLMVLESVERSAAARTDPTKLAESEPNQKEGLIARFVENVQARAE